MKTFHRVLMPLAVALLSTLALAQSEAPKPADKPALSEAQESFNELKTLAGAWQGPVVTDPPMPSQMYAKPLRITLRVTSRGNAIVHEMKEAGTPDDPTRYDDPITMLYLDSGRLMLTHYCDAGNRPRMVGKISPDGKKVEFDFLDVAGSTRFGHMDHAVFTFVDANHHIEDWTYLTPGDKPMHAHFDLQRVQ